VTDQRWPRVKALFEAAVERPADARDAFLAAATGDDAALRREVESLLAADIADAGFLDQLPAGGISLVEHPGSASLEGQRLGAYEIVSRIGAGGMGEVYKARDTRLNRIVAIKVLPPHASSDPGSRERMEREARAVAALKHPNICTLHDIGSQHGVDFLVMEYVDGETLSSRLSRGELSIAEALRYAEQIASALAAAHRAGIVHRDVKPANIILDRSPVHSTEAPHAKLLDFGLAEINRFDTSSGSVCREPESALDLTRPAFVLGTVQYMAPERFDDDATDARTDIFAFGAVLFEMLTRRKAFEGAGPAEVRAVIRECNVRPPSGIDSRVPAALDRIVLRCLAKNRSARYQTCDEVLVDVRAVQRRLAASVPVRPMAIGAAVVASVVGASAWMIWSRPHAQSPAAVIRMPGSAGVIDAPALSPDGSSVVFSWLGDEFRNPELVLVRIGSASRTRLTDDQGNEQWPAWSPDGRQIAFIRSTADRCGIFSMPVGGGPEHKLRDLRFDRYYALAWSPDGRSIAYAERHTAHDPYSLFLLSIDTLVPRRLTAPQPGNLGDLRFAFSPDGSMLAVIRLEQTISVHLVSVETGADRIVLNGQQEWFGSVVWAADGRHLILSGDQQGVRRLWRLPTTGGALEELAIAGEDSYFPSVSPRSGRLAFVREFHDWDLSRVSLGNRVVHTPVAFPSSARLDLDPAFSPDGRKLAFVSERSGSRELWVSNADGTHAVQLTSLGWQKVGQPSWSPDGRFLAFHGSGILVIPSAGGSAHRVADDGGWPSWSADGRWIYFRRDLGGAFHVWKVPAAGGPATQAIATEAIVARERRDRAGVYFAGPRGGLWRLGEAGAEATPVLPDFDSSLSGYWTVGSDGIYYVTRETLADNTVVNHLNFFDFAGHRTIGLGTLPGVLDAWVGGLTVSPDRKTVVYSHRAYQSSEVMLVEHFE
jgi:eukaryotic-like serine/threonine-protein kinase